MKSDPPHPEKLQRSIEKLGRELGPNFNSMPPDELLRIAASNSFQNGKAIREIKIMVTVATVIVLAIAARTFGVI